MAQENKNKYQNTTKSTDKSQYNDFSDCSGCGNGCSGCGSVEPLPESSRPRRDGPGGEDGE